MTDRPDSEAKAPPGGIPLGMQRRIRILTYHRILPDVQVRRRAGVMEIGQETFRCHVRWLERWGYTAITFHDYRLFLRKELDLPAKPVIITFDDGYEDTFRYAFPVLREFGMTAVVFVVADPAIRTNIWERAPFESSVRLLSDQQILEMHSAGFEIGSHSLTHRRLTELDPSVAWEEISRSRMLLEILLNSSVQSFGYPYGLVNTSVKEMVREAGYDIAVSGWTGPPRFGTDLLETRRILMPGTRTAAGFGFRLGLPYQYFRWLVWKAKDALRAVVPPTTSRS